MGMYRWAAYFLNEWNVDCSHVTTFNMDEWADCEGDTLPNTNLASFEYSMKEAFFGKFNNTIPKNQRNFATKENLPTYESKIAALKAEGAKLVLVYGIGRILGDADILPTEFGKTAYPMATLFNYNNIKFRHKSTLDILIYVGSQRWISFFCLRN